MTSKMTVTIEIVQEDGHVVRQTRTEDIPGYEDFKRNGFSDSFDKIETALLEARKKVSDTAVESYLNEISKKKSMSNPKQPPDI